MFYKVTARIREESAGKLRRKLQDGTISGQKPEGYEIVASMQRAVVKENGEIEWSEVCYCPSPLAHERQTVYDHHFRDIQTEVVDGYLEHQGRPFLEYLNELAGASG